MTPAVVFMGKGWHKLCLAVGIHFCIVLVCVCLLPYFLKQTCWLLTSSIGAVWFVCCPPIPHCMIIHSCWPWLLNTRLITYFNLHLQLLPCWFTKLLAMTASSFSIWCTSKGKQAGWPNHCAHVTSNSLLTDSNYGFVLKLNTTTPLSFLLLGFCVFRELARSMLAHACSRIIPWKHHCIAYQHAGWTV